MSSIFGDLFPVVSSVSTLPQYTGSTNTSGGNTNSGPDLNRLGGPSAGAGNQSISFEFNGIEVDVGRAADQAQNAFQGARAFSGSQVNNTLNQEENVSQEAHGLNEKFLTYEPPAPNENAFLETLNTALFGSRYLAKGRAENAQDQIGGQNAVSSGWDASGNPSEAKNELLQKEVVEQIIDSAKVRTIFDLRQPGYMWNQAGSRRIDGIFDEHNAEATLFNKQRQGYTTSDPAQKGNTLFDNPATQFASADGTLSVNNMVQDALSNQRASSIIETLIDLRRDPADAFDTGNTEIAFSMNGDFVDGINPGANRAVTIVESVQEQALVQQAQAGVDEAGNLTGNGGVAVNNSIQTANNVQVGEVYHLTDVLI